MKSSARLYQCCRCHAQVIVCRRCDRGQRYCVNGCSKKARHESLNRANQKYQLTRAGRFNNAARQASFRERQKQKVTDQGSTQSLHHASLKAMLDQAKSILKERSVGVDLCCHHCGERCQPFLRLDYLQQTRFKRSFRRDWHPD
tara:strand:+ start:261 stop:692 length:432 start_codon:yes stop_codon:yes gene_type:complete